MVCLLSMAKYIDRERAFPFGKWHAYLPWLNKQDEEKKKIINFHLMV